MPSDLVAQGLPFYSGSVTYAVPVAANAGGLRVFVCLEARRAGASLLAPPEVIEYVSEGKP